jgi:MFS family permease
VAALLLAQLGLFAASHHLVGMLAALLLYFTAFNLVEASLPSLVAKMAPAAAKGTAMGFFSTSQFLGAFAGGLLGGMAHQTHGIEGVFLVGAGAALVWLLVVSGLSNPRYLSSQLLNVGVLDEVEARLLTQRLLEIPGVAEAVVVAEDGVAYLKVDKSNLDPEALSGFNTAQATA